VPRVNMVLKRDSSGQIKKVFGTNGQNGKSAEGLYRTLAHSPLTLKNLMKLESDLSHKAKLPPKLRELIILRISILAGSRYEWNQHQSIALNAGATQEQIDTIHEWPESKHFDSQEKAVLRYVDQVTLNIRATDRTFRMLRKYFNDRTIIELTATIGFWGMIVRLVEPLEIQSD